MPTPLLIHLPQGLNVSGVTLWGVRLANAMAERGRCAAVVLHAEPAGQRRLELPLHPEVVTIDMADLPPLHAAAGDLAPYLPRLRTCVRRLAEHADSPVCLSPNLLGDSYGLAAALALVEPDSVRILGWQHSDITYDTRMLAHYQPMISRFVGVSERIEQRLAEALPTRRAHVRRIPYGVPVAETCPKRAEICTPSRSGSSSPLSGGAGWQPASPPPSSSLRPIRLIYTGRIEHEQKRIGALPLLADRLKARGIAFTLTLLGDGPAVEEIDSALARHKPYAQRLDPLGPDDVRRHLAEADALVLPSRYEGLSISMLEALGQGCVPIVTRIASGAAEAVDDGRTGILADAGPDDTPERTADALAEAVERLLASDLPAMSQAAHAVARERYSIDAHADAVAALLDEAAADEPRPWPATRPCAFAGDGSGGGGSGSVPQEGAARLRAVLRGLAGRRIVLHGAGRHTIELAHVLAESPATILAIADDDPARHSDHLFNWPIIAPADAAGTGATAVLISSWMHESAIWERRGVYERQGLRVHRLYTTS